MRETFEGKERSTRWSQNPMETETNKSKEVESLIERAAKAEKSEDAMRFSQAACNSANALCALKIALAK